MENEAPTEIKRLFKKSKTVVKLAPPHTHRLNAAERAIRTFKNHFVAGLALVDNYFPIYLWCRIANQAETTINILRIP